MPFRASHTSLATLSKSGRPVGRNSPANAATWRFLDQDFGTGTNTVSVTESGPSITGCPTWSMAQERTQVSALAVLASV